MRGLDSRGTESHVGGDWYDAFELPDGRIAVCVGDVVGHGLQAAVIMSQLRQSMRTLALEGHSPFVVLDQTGKVLRHTYRREGMATAIFGLLDLQHHTFAYASAGHPAPLNATQSSIAALTCGVRRWVFSISRPPSERTIQLPSPALLVLYTDGLIESTRNVAEGEGGLVRAASEEVATPAGDPAAAILGRMINNQPPTTWPS